MKNQVRHVMNKIKFQCYGHFALTSCHLLSSVQIDFTKIYTLLILCLLYNVRGVWVFLKLHCQPVFFLCLLKLNYSAAATAFGVVPGRGRAAAGLSRGNKIVF